MSKKAEDKMVDVTKDVITALERQGVLNVKIRESINEIITQVNLQSATVESVVNMQNKHRAEMILMKATFERMEAQIKNIEDKLKEKNNDNS